jgi:hypothetical protein
MIAFKPKIIFIMLSKKSDGNNNYLVKKLFLVEN